MAEADWVTVLYFAAARQRAGMDSERLDLAGMTVQAAMDRIVELHPELAAIRPHLRIALNQTFAEPTTQIPPGAELAMIPPVAGGDGELAVGQRVWVRDAKLSVDETLEYVTHPSCGAQVFMVGVVRDHNEGESVERLRYEAYVPMAEKVISAIVDDTEQKYPGIRCAVQHRVGPLEIGDRAVVVAVGAPHRKEAFAACQEIIDRLKEDAPIWKHEHREGGQIWVGLGP